MVIRNFKEILIKPKIYTALTIGGSDPIGGAGIQADLKTFNNFRIYGTSVITAITSQNTFQFKKIINLKKEDILSQIDAIYSDFEPNAVKTGLLPTVESIEAVILAAEKYRIKNLVVDPITSTTTGENFFNEEWLEAMKKLISRALVITPNLKEAKILANMKEEIKDIEGMKNAAVGIFNLGVKNVIIKGGHLNDFAVDLFFNGNEFVSFQEKKQEIGDIHGTGCAFSAAITAGLAKEKNVVDSTLNAKIFITKAIKSSFKIGKGMYLLNFRV